MKKLNVFRLGLLFAGCFLGAGYVSGQELRQYFVVYGAKGYLGLLVAVAILYIFGVLCLRMAQRTGPSVSRISPPQSSIADIAICEIVPSTGRSVRRTAMVSGRSRLYQWE